jgi:hypothetical protein
VARQQGDLASRHVQPGPAARRLRQRLLGGCPGSRLVGRASQVEIDHAARGVVENDDRLRTGKRMSRAHGAGKVAARDQPLADEDRDAR